jgi:hypothetical protein
MVFKTALALVIGLLSHSFSTHAQFEDGAFAFETLDNGSVLIFTEDGSDYRLERRDGRLRLPHRIGMVDATALLRILAELDLVSSLRRLERKNTANLRALFSRITNRYSAPEEQTSRVRLFVITANVCSSFHDRRCLTSLLELAPRSPFASFDPYPSWNVEPVSSGTFA